MSEKEEFSSAAVAGQPPQYYLPAQQGGYPPQQGYPQQQGGYPQPQGGYPQGGQAQWQGPPGGAVGVAGGTVVVVQPAYTGSKPNDFLPFSIVTLICFNLIFGIIALVCSLNSRDAAAAGDLERAKAKSKCALGWNVSALVIWVIAIVIAITVYALALQAAASIYWRG